MQVRVTKEIRLVVCHYSYLEHSEHFPYKTTFQMCSKITKKPEGAVLGLATESTTDFAGFAEDEIALSCLKSLTANASIENPLVAFRRGNDPTVKDSLLHPLWLSLNVPLHRPQQVNENPV